MKLKQEIYDLILSDSVLQAEIVKASGGSSFSSVRRWAINQDEKLCNYSILQAILSYLSSYSSVDELLQK